MNDAPRLDALLWIDERNHSRQADYNARLATVLTHASDSTATTVPEQPSN